MPWAAWAGWRAKSSAWSRIAQRGPGVVQGRLAGSPGRRSLPERGRRQDVEPPFGIGQRRSELEIPPAIPVAQHANQPPQGAGGHASHVESHGPLAPVAEHRWRLAGEHQVGDGQGNQRQHPDGPRPGELLPEGGTAQQVRGLQKADEGQPGQAASKRDAGSIRLGPTLTRWLPHKRKQGEVNPPPGVSSSDKTGVAASWTGTRRPPAC